MQAYLSVKVGLSSAIIGSMTTKRKIDLARGQRIKYVRRELLDLRAQEDFAEALSNFTGRPITRGAVGNWEQGKEIGLENLKAISEMAGISLDWLAYNSGETPTKGEGETKLPANVVRVMGYVGAGAVIEPEFEQTPPEGLDQIQLAIPIPDDMIAFQVRGISMLPRYDEGDVIIVWRDQKRATDSFLGEEAAVRTRDGRRYLKTIRRGQRAYTLESWNDHPIEDVEIEWVGEIYVTLRASQLRRMVNQINRQGGIQGQLKLRA